MVNSAINPVRIIGIGNPSAGDDSLGMIIARKLKKLHSSGVDIVEAGMAPLDILHLLEGATSAILVDATMSGQGVGTITRLELPRDMHQLTHFSWSSSSSTHQFGLADSLILGMELRTLPQHLTLFGIELGQTTLGTTLSPQVSQAIDQVVSRISQECEELACMNSK